MNLSTILLADVFIMSPGKMIFAVLELTVALTVSFKLISF